MRAIPSSTPWSSPNCRPTSLHLLGILAATSFIRSESSGSLSKPAVYLLCRPVYKYRTIITVNYVPNQLSFTLIWSVTTCIKTVQVNSYYLSFFIRHVAIAIAVGWSQGQEKVYIYKTKKIELDGWNLEILFFVLESTWLSFSISLTHAVFHWFTAECWWMLYNPCIGTTVTIITRYNKPLYTDYSDWWLVLSIYR